jgi:hypothetical protein
MSSVSNDNIGALPNPFQYQQKYDDIGQMLPTAGTESNAANKFTARLILEAEKSQASRPHSGTLHISRRLDATASSRIILEAS